MTFRLIKDENNPNHGMIEFSVNSNSVQIKHYEGQFSYTHLDKDNKVYMNKECARKVYKEKLNQGWKPTNIPMILDLT